MGVRIAGRLPALSVIVAIAVSWFGCAKVAAPTGGPEDRTLPRVAAMAPDSGSVGGLPDTISILFSKAMDRRSVRDWLFITPPVAISDKRWTGNRYEIILGEKPDSGRTYVLLLGAEVVDRRKNPLGPWSAAFSTGRSLDDGWIEGVVRSVRLKSANVYLYVWPWSDQPPDSGGEVPPPLRMGQCARDGKFRIDFLPRNLPLRVCALYDSRQDRSYDPEDDLWGCAGEAIALADTTVSRTGVEIFLVLPDEPGVVKGTVIDSSCVGRGAGALLALGREADSLAVLLGEGTRGDSLSADTLVGFGERPGIAVDTLAARLRYAAIDSLLPSAREDSARCAIPIIVRLLEGDSTLVAEVQGDGPFEFRDLAPGIYRLRAFRDADGDGEPGPAERIGEYATPIELLPGRTLDDLELFLRQQP